MPQSSQYFRWSHILCAVVACAALLSSPASAAELLAVLELSGALPADQRQALTDAVRQAATDATAPTGIKVMTQENMEILLTDMGVDSSCISEGVCAVDTLRNLQANYGVTGKVTNFSGTYVVTLQLYEMAGGTMMGSENAKSGEALELFDPLVPDATQALLTRLPGVGNTAPKTQAHQALQVLPAFDTSRLSYREPAPCPYGDITDLYVEKRTIHLGGDQYELGAKDLSPLLQTLLMCGDVQAAHLVRETSSNWKTVRIFLFIPPAWLGLSANFPVYRTSRRELIATLSGEPVKRSYNFTPTLNMARENEESMEIYADYSGGDFVKGDTVVAIGGVSVRSAKEIAQVEKLLKPGSTVTVIVQRGGMGVEIERSVGARKVK